MIINELFESLKLKSKTSPQWNADNIMNIFFIFELQIVQNLNILLKVILIVMGNNSLIFNN
jgi:hypothetical protein